MRMLDSERQAGAFRIEPAEGGPVEERGPAPGGARPFPEGGFYQPSATSE